MLSHDFFMGVVFLRVLDDVSILGDLRIRTEGLPDAVFPGVS